MQWRRVLVAVPIAALATLPAGTARGDWPVGRHDPQRTGAAVGASDITTPERRWQYYLGGSLTATGAIAADLDGNGLEEYVMAAGGALVARRFDDSVLWRVPPRDIQSVVGVSDLDGDGDDEIVVTALRSVLVVDAATGTIEWETSSDDIALLGGVRMADLDGDQLDDLLIVECGPCCSVSRDWPGAAFGFAAGADQPVELWRLPQLTCGQDSALTVFDSDGDGDLEVLAGTADWYQLLDGATGAELARTGDLGASMQFASCTPIDVDGGAGAELACILNHPFYAADRSVFVLDWDGATLRPLWRTFLTQPSDELRTIELATDLGGGPRVVMSTRPDSDAAWSTHVLDAATGAETDLLADELVAGTAPRPGGGRYLITASDTGLRGWRDDGGTLTAAWSRAGDEDPLVAIDHAAARRSSLAGRAAILPRTGRLLVVPRSSVNNLRALSLADAGTAQAAEIFLALNVRVAAVFLFPEIPERPFAMARSDGYLTPLDEQLISQLGVDDVQLPGIRTGGYYATGTFRELGGPPRAADLDDDGFDEVVLGDSRGALIRLDPEHAGFAVPPRPRWAIAETTAPAVTTAGDGSPALACIQRDTSNPLVPTYAVALHSPDAELLWTAPLAGLPMTDVIPGRFDGDTVDDLVVQWGSPADVLLHTVALSGVDGAVLWENVSDPGWGRAPAGVATGAWPGESSDVVVHVGENRVSALAGDDGGVVAQSPAIGYPYFLPMLVDVDDDAALEVALTGGFSPISLLEDNLTPAWESSDLEQRPYPYGSLARCPDGRSVLISQSRQYPARLTMTTVSPIGRGEERALWLGGGNAFVSQALMDDAGVWAGQLTSSTVHHNLSGADRPSALVGSSDGHLYLIDPCEASFDTAVAFDAAVGEAVYADTDGDGKDEILVTTGDGDLHALQNHSIDAPAQVYDLDLETAGSADIDELDNRIPLSARWDEVAGATGYEVALVDEREDRYVTNPPWRAVTEPRIVFTDLETNVGDSFRVAVRAVGPDGRSIDVVSDGVITIDVEDPTSPSSGCCDSGRSGAGGTGALLTVIVLVLRRRRGRSS